MEESNPELESFRQQWRAEVSARSREAKSTTAASSSAKPVHKPVPSAHIPSARHRLGKAPEPSHRVHHHDHDEHVQTLSFDGPAPSSAAPDAIEGAPKEDSEKTGSREPRTALEHYEKAVERETLGSLGDSLSLYRKAFRVGSNCAFPRKALY